MSMPQQRGTETSQLANVIEVIQLGRKTGILTVERGVDSFFESGQITFVNGQITQARCNRIMQSQQALLWLKSWSACRFLFVAEQDTAQTTQPLPAIQQIPRKRDTQPQRVPSASLQTPTPSLNADLLAVPQPMQHLEQALQRIEQAHLSRTHRQLFLLIDGQRNAIELLRLTGRRQDEGLKILRDLAYIGVIR